MNLIVAEGKEQPDEKVLAIKNEIIDKIRLVSVYKGIPAPSILFDSTGTKKIAALASYIIEGLEQGRILVIDELDSSIHFKLTRAIVAMFNSMFSNLKKFQAANFRKEQGRVLLYLPDKVLECEIVECRQVSVRDSVYDIMQEERQELLEEIVLSTCSTSSDRRLILRMSIVDIS